MNVPEKRGDSHEKILDCKRIGLMSLTISMAT